MDRVSRRLVFIASVQGGVITREQAMEYGMTSAQVRAMVETGRWRRLARGVYATDLPVWEQLAWAGLLQAGEGACLGGSAAGYLYGINGQPPQIDIWVPPGRSVPRRRDTPVPKPVAKAGRSASETGGDPELERLVHEMWNPWRFHQGVRTVVGNPPRSGVEETVLDLCEGKLHSHFREEDPVIWFQRSYPPMLRGWMRAVIRPVLDSGLTTVDKLRNTLDARPQMEGGVLIRWELGQMEQGLAIGAKRKAVRRRDPRGKAHPITD